MSGGRFSIYLRRTILLLSIGCLVAAAGMMIVVTAQEFHAAARRNGDKEAAGHDLVQQEGVTQRDGPMTVRSLRQSDEHGMRMYDGDVRIDLPPLSLQCQHVQRQAEGSGHAFRLAGYGGVTARGPAGFPQLAADNFLFDSRDGGLLTLAGEVRVEGRDGLRKYRLCTIAMDGRIVVAKSLLDDFAQSQSVARKLALLDDITAIYRDEELPPEAGWLLAMKLLEPHLTWHGTASGDREAPSKNAAAAAVDPAVWPEAHSGEPWMRQDAEEKLYWRLGERRHVDVLRAVKLLQRPGADAADAARRREWLAEIARNNTMLRTVVEPAYPSSRTASVVLDARNADRVTVKLYRVGNGAAWAAVRQRQGRDFIYADAAAPFAAVTQSAPAGPKKLGDLMENMVVQWTVEPDQLPRIPPGTIARAFTACGASWCGNRKLAIAAEALEKPGYYVLSAEANGEKAYAPIRVEGK